MCLEVRHLPSHLPPHDVTNLHSLVIKKAWQYVQMCVSLSLYVFLESFSFGSFFFLLFDCFVLLSSVFILANLLLLLYYYYYYYRYMFVSKINTHKPKAPFVELMTGHEQNTLANNAVCLREQEVSFIFKGFFRRVCHLFYFERYFIIFRKFLI